MTRTRWVEWKIRSLDLAEVIDAHRVWPKAFIVCLLILTWKVACWFMTLPARGTEDTAFASIVFAAMAKAFDWYCQGGRTWISK